ncbi:MAG: potassium channel family protein [Flavobacteriales bacterium]|jgi:probable ion transporter|nr:potassium channel family protein [Flavobacteriales bacterium]
METDRYQYNYYHKATIFQAALLSLSVFVLICLLADAVFYLPPEMARLISIYDNTLCIFLLGDFFVRLMNAPDKFRFMRYGWFDLLSSIPAFGTGYIRDITRISRLLRIYRIYYTVRYVLKRLRSNPEERIFLLIACSVVSVLMMTSIAILAVETAPDSNILTAEDSLWWAITTISTVGYGDLYPVTGAGRLIGGVLMVCGTIVIGAISAYISSWVARKR